MSDELQEQEVIIKPVPRWHKYLPFVGTDLVRARFPYIYLPDFMYRRWLRNELSIQEESVLIHESMHIQRQKAMGPFWFSVKYFISPHFRLHEELVAIREQMVYLKQQGEFYDFDRKAKQFASYEYFWVTSFEEGRKMLEGLWSQVDANKQANQ